MQEPSLNDTLAYLGDLYADTFSKQVVFECPLAASHIVAGMELFALESKKHKDGAPALPNVTRAYHPIELFARAYDLGK